MNSGKQEVHIHDLESILQTMEWLKISALQLNQGTEGKQLLKLGTKTHSNVGNKEPHRVLTLFCHISQPTLDLFEDSAELVSEVSWLLYHFNPSVWGGLEVWPEWPLEKGTFCAWGNQIIFQDFCLKGCLFHEALLEFLALFQIQQIVSCFCP